jgi:hypothetical protein
MLPASEAEPPGIVVLAGLRGASLEDGNMGRARTCPSTRFPGRQPRRAEVVDRAERDGGRRRRCRHLPGRRDAPERLPVPAPPAVPHR